MVRRSTGTDIPEKVTSSDISRVMAAMGRRGGKIGGKTPYADHDGRGAERRGPESR